MAEQRGTNKHVWIDFFFVLPSSEQPSPKGNQYVNGMQKERQI